jgi:site-specific DNA-methyltransferase (adenine-specific)
MEPWHHDDRATIYNGDCLEVLRALPDASVDAVVTDPPYGLEFMGKDWDKFSPTAMKKRSGWDTADSGASVKEDLGQPYGRVAFHKRRSTYECDGCGKRDGFRNPHECEGKWQPVWVDPLPVESLTFQAWSQAWVTECLRVLKPGGHLLAFGGTRTWHRLACAIEDAGFEVRDSIAWMYGSGFPKSLDVSKAIDKAAGAERQVIDFKRTNVGMQGGNFTAGSEQADVPVTAPATDAAREWSGWGTALKPAHEPIVVARKPLVGTVAANVLEHGTGALNIDGCRVAGEVPSVPQPVFGVASGVTDFGAGVGRNGEMSSAPNGRWPANVVLDEDQAAELNKQSGVRSSPRPYTKSKAGWLPPTVEHVTNELQSVEYGDSGGASRFFYVAKAPARERPKVDGTAHPTVKPLTLMRWLCRLVTAPNGVILEPFAGSGTTVEAALLEGFRVIAIEREADYLPLIQARLDRVAATEPTDEQLTLDASA